MNKPKPKVAVVILNWNGKRFLKKFLPSVIASNYSYLELIVADNQSDDDSLDFLRNEYPSIRVIINSTNEGFAKGYNTALKQVQSDYYVLLNSDVEVTENWITPVIELMESNPKYAACTPTVLSYHEKEKYEYAGAAGGYLDKYGYPFCRGRIFDQVESYNRNYETSEEVFWASGAALFVRADLYHQFGGLDESLFAHMEEIDFCWRLQNNYYKVLTCHKSVIYHVGGGTLQQGNPQKTYLNFRNNLIVLIKNYPKEAFLKTLTIRAFLDLIASIKFLLSGDIKNFLAVLRALSFILKNKKKIFKRRTNVPNTAAHLKGFYKESIVINFFLKNKKKFSDLNL